jgi:hypothetical protein
MYKRVPRRKERLKENWPSVFEAVSSVMTEWLDFEEANTDETDTTRLARLSALRTELKKELEYYRGYVPLSSEIPLKSMVMESRLGIPRILSAMTWRFCTAPQGYGFLTSDDPVFYSDIYKSYAEVSFPISKSIALILSWYDIEQGFFTASPEIVKEINQRTANKAQHQVYYSSAEKWVLNLLEEDREGYYLIYP